MANTSEPVSRIGLRRILLRACPADAAGRKNIRLLADAIGCTHQTIYARWLKPCRIPVDAVDRLVAVSDGRVTREECLPYVFNRNS